MLSEQTGRIFLFNDAHTQTNALQPVAGPGAQTANHIHQRRFRSQAGAEVEDYQRTVEANGLLLFPLLLEVRRQPELSETISTSLDIINSLGKLLARYQSDGDLVQEHPLHAVAALLGPLMIINLMQNASPDLPLPAVDLPGHVRQFLDGRRPSS